MEGSRVRPLFLAVVALLIGALAAPPSIRAEQAPVRVGTTVSLERSGLLAVLMQAFAKQSGRGVRILGRGTAAALALGRRGEVDVLLSPASPEEAALFADELAVARSPFLESRFVIAGPKADPAAVARVTSPEQAIAHIARLRAPFVRRADDSDVRARERKLFQAAGLDPELRWETLVETTDGMADALSLASQRRAYVLADLAAFLGDRERLELVALSRPAESLRQVYSVVRLDAKRVGVPIDGEGAQALERFLLSPEAQGLIRDYGLERYGEAVFVPTSAGGAP